MFWIKYKILTEPEHGFISLQHINIQKFFSIYTYNIYSPSSELKLKDLYINIKILTQHDIGHL